MPQALEEAMSDHDGTAGSTGVLRGRMVRAAVAVGAVMLLVAGAIGIRTLTASAATGNGLYPLAYNRFQATPVPVGARLVGHHNANDQLRVELILHPQHEAELTSLIQHLNTKGDPLYRHWLTGDQFRAEFAPAAIDTRWLTTRGLREVAGPSPFVRVFTGTTAQVEAAFHTTINDYRTPEGEIVYANATEPLLPLTLEQNLGGVVGLDNVLARKDHPEYQRPSQVAGKPHFGGGPGGGLTPSQVRGIYNANPVYHFTNGGGKKLAVFELSGYKQSDIRRYELQYGLPNVPINNIQVDAGPCSAVVPCDYGAIEVELDIEYQIALAPGTLQVQVYNGPNTTAGVIDTYFTIANYDSADAISTSWGQCESSLPAGQTFGEYLAFSEMAIQGQSIFAAAGDAGAYDCEHDFTVPPFPPYLKDREVDDPANNPYMTGVGGTSFFQTFDPGTNAHPTYPAGKEYVWDTINNCRTTDFFFKGTDYGLCPFGAGGGGNSGIWAKPYYQSGPGTTTIYSEFGPYCGQAAKVQCREVPDVSLNADPNSGYSEYCTDASGGCPSSGWFQIGGTSCAAPFWAAIAELADSFGHERVGLADIDLYNLNNPTGYSTTLHDMVGGGHYTFDGTSYFTNRNGYGTPIGFPEEPDYDMATGLGTPNIAAVVPWLS
jgi:subtilase family serine protease